ncbi:MAG TPA: MAPEG family protein [Burkholderiaceae bacterium]|nr:MAPEG family protein [Burkholderiaceae bacterium]
MPPVHIFWPVVALAAWTFVVLLIVPIVRVRAHRRKEVRVRDFSLGESANVPEHVSLPNRNLMNLLEMPVLFYVACLVLYVTGGATYMMTLLAWLYVAARVAHSLIHMTSNHIPYRMSAFAVSCLALAILWVGAALHMASVSAAG